MMERIRRPRWSLPPFSTGYEVVSRLAHLARPGEKLSVLEFAVRHQEYDPNYLPWQCELKTALHDGEVSEVGLLGPVQTGKTKIGLAWIGCKVISAPGPTMIGLPSQALTGRFSATKLDAMIQSTEVVSKRLMPVQNASNVLHKKFRGADILLVWPEPVYFTQTEIRYGWLDDYDQFPDDIGGTANKGGQGSGIGLLRGRLTSFEGRSKMFISSTPASDGGGKTEAYIEEGTNEFVHPRCPSCGERWEIDLLRDLKFDKTGSPDLAMETVEVHCRAGNGCVLGAKDRRALLNGLTDLPNYGFVRRNETATGRVRTFHVDGLLCMTSWPQLAFDWRKAQIEWENRQDESHLRTFVQTKAGRNYRSQLSGEKPLGREHLAPLMVKGFKAGIVPRGPKTWAIMVDTQADRFECAAIGFAEGHRSWLIRRWTLDVLDDGITPLEPFRKPEHWRMLLPLFDKRFEMEGAGMTPPPLVVGFDTGGGGDRNDTTATQNAKEFWHLARAAGVAANRIMLLRGNPRPMLELVKAGEFSERKAKGGPKRTGAPVLWLVNVHKIKSIIDARLRRTDDGPGRVYLPEDLAEHHQNEIIAEELVAGKWLKRKGEEYRRNETWDLMIYGWAGLIKPPFAQSRDHMRWVPPAYRIVWPKLAVTEEKQEQQAEVETPKPSPAKSARNAPARRGRDWYRRR